MSIVLSAANAKPKYPQYANCFKRLETFKRWPTYVPISVKMMVDAGLVYTGVGDAVRCYHCGGGLRNWEPGDNPWCEHAKWYSTCPHVHFIKGQSFINKTLNGDLISETVNEYKHDDPMNTVATLSCIENGYDKTIVQTDMTIAKKHTNGTILNTIEPAGLCDEIIADISNTVEKTTIRATVDTNEYNRLKKENQQLKDNITCKICLDSKATVIFLPCGHMVSCAQCAMALSLCPMCRVVIEKYIKVFT